MPDGMPPPAPKKANEIYNRYIEETNQNTAPEALIPVVYQLRLEKIARSCKNLEAEVLEMGEYTKGLHRPRAPIMRTGTSGRTWIYLKKNCSNSSKNIPSQKPTCQFIGYEGT